jgi:hypothetical protein
MFRFNDRIDLAPALYTGSPNVRVLPTGPRSNRLRAFWLQPISVFGWFALTMRVDGSPKLGLSSSLTLQPP